MTITTISDGRGGRAATDFLEQFLLHCHVEPDPLYFKEPYRRFCELFVCLPPIASQTVIAGHINQSPQRYGYHVFKIIAPF